MAAALEFAKLVVASYLHNHWNKAGWMKWYLTLAVGVLMIITSAGIYGFLTAAYQKTADQLGVMDKQINVIELKKNRFNEQLNYFMNEKSSLSTSIGDLRNGITNNKIQYKDTLGNIITTQSSSTRRLLTKELDLAVQSRNDISIKIESVTDSITRLDLQILDLESNNEIAAEIGPLRYMSEITGKAMNVIVNWFTLLIVFVFDPLAIAMVIALNKLLGNDKKNKEDEDIDDSDKFLDIIDDGMWTEKTGGDSEKEVEKEQPQKKQSQKEEVRFVPNEKVETLDTKELYGESIKRNSKHNYADTSKK